MGLESGEQPRFERNLLVLKFGLNSQIGIMLHLASAYLQTPTFTKKVLTEKVKTDISPTESNLFYLRNPLKAERIVEGIYCGVNMITVTQKLKCEAKGCKEETEVYGSQVFGASYVLPNVEVPEGWNVVQLNYSRGIVYCPKHLVSVDVKLRKRRIAW